MSLLPRTLSTLGLAALGLACGVAAAAAEPCSDRVCTVTNTVQVHVGTVLRLSIQGPTEVVAAASQETLLGGSAPSAGPSAVVRSNGAWRLVISAGQDVWTPLDASARADKPASDLSWSTSADAAFADLSPAPVEAVRGGPTGATALPLYYRTRFSPDSDTPGTYSMVVRLTLVGA